MEMEALPRTIEIEKEIEDELRARAEEVGNVVNILMEATVKVVCAVSKKAREGQRVGKILTHAFASDFLPVHGRLIAEDPQEFCRTLVLWTRDEAERHLGLRPADADEWIKAGKEHPEWRA